MAAPTADDTSPTPKDPYTDDTQRLLDAAFDEFDVADLVESHSELVISMSETIERLERALETRGVIGEALGICIERYGNHRRAGVRVPGPVSQDQNVRLRDVAAHLVERTVSPEDSSGRE
jgi:hypothetical protein